MGLKQKINCQYCNSTETIKYGKTSRGIRRYKCKSCNKTWINSATKKYIKPPIEDIVARYFDGASVRELVPYYNSSPLRINQKIRTYLENVPHWEDYLDSIVAHHSSSIIYLMGEHFSCKVEGSEDNHKYLAMAIDGLSSTVLGYEIADQDSAELWDTLIKRLKKRSISSQTYMSSGSKFIVDSIKNYFPTSMHRINFAKSYRNKEISCCLFKLPIRTKLIIDLINMYNSLENKNLNEYLSEHHNTNFQKLISRHQKEFIKYLETKFDLTHIRLENLAKEFKERFDKFHMIKHDPQPLVNGWIAHNMLKNLDDKKTSRIWHYLFYPNNANFKLFAENERPEQIVLEEDELHQFILELGHRILQLPLRVSHCELTLDSCSEI